MVTSFQLPDRQAISGFPVVQQARCWPRVMLAEQLLEGISPSAEVRRTSAVKPVRKESHLAANDPMHQMSISSRTPTGSHVLRYSERPRGTALGPRRAR